MSLLIKSIVPALLLITLSAINTVSLPASAVSTNAPPSHPVGNSSTAHFLSLPPNPAESCYFKAGTKVTSGHSTELIEKITKGDDVTAYDSKEKKDVSKTVIGTAHADVKELVEVQLLGQDKIDCTPDVKFWVEKQGWKTAKSLFPGDLLLQQDGSHPRVYNVVFRRIPAHVYKIDVKDLHNYFVGPHGVLVAS